MTEEQHLEWLKKKLAEYEAELAKAEEVLARLAPLAAHLREFIQGLQNEIYKDGLAPAGMPTEQLSSQEEGGADEVASGVTARTEKLSRRPEFRDMTASTALTRILRTEPRPFHADEVAHALFDIRSREDFDRAKRIVVTELIRAANRHDSAVVILGGNRFASKNTTSPNPDVHSPELSLPIQAIQPSLLKSQQAATDFDQQVELREKPYKTHSQGYRLDHRPLQPGTKKYECYILLKERGMFMSSQELAEGLKDKGVNITYSGHAKLPEVLGSVLRKSIDRGEELFVRNQERKFGLIEWVRQVGVSPPS